MSHLSKGLDNDISHYVNILFLRDFTYQILENYVYEFCNA